VPIVTEAGDESPESMYLKNGINGFIVPKGDVKDLSAKLRLLLEDERMRERFSRAARTEISTNGHIDRMCEGFTSSLRFVCDSRS
jgi:glycosyltransferase involved in cell wall biosynthesis